MSSSTETPDTSPETGPTVEVLRHDIGALVDLREATGVDGEYLWPVPPLHLAMLFRASAEHARAITLKAEGAFGSGLVGTGAATLDAICDGGASDLFTGLGMDLECYGNAFMQVVQGSGGRPAQLRRLPSLTMSRYRGGFLQRTPRPDGSRKIVTFGPDEILHLREPCVQGRAYALPSWIGAEGMLELTRAAVAYNARFFSNSAMPEYAVIFEGTVPSEAQKAMIRSFFRQDFQGLENAHRTLLLHHAEGQKVTFKQLTADSKDGDFLKLLDAARDRIVTAHGVPPRMLGIVAAGQLGGGGEVTGQMFIFEHLTLSPRRRRMMGRLSPILAKLGLTATTAEEADGAPGRVAFAPLDLTPPDQDIPPLAELVQAGILTADEAYASLPISARPVRDPSRQAPALKSAEGAIDLLAAILGRS